MRIKFRDLWTWEGTLSRGAYAIIGVVGFAIKNNLDRLVASVFFDRPWSIFNYWIPLHQAIRVTSLSPADTKFLLAMVVLSFPFMWVGVVCTLKRIRDTGLPLAWVVVFFLPFINLAFFILFCLIPSQKPQETVAETPGQRTQTRLGAWIPHTSFGSAALAVLFTGINGCALAYFGIDVIEKYGWGLFVALPFCMGFVAVVIYGYHGFRSFGNAMSVSCMSVFVLALFLATLGLEGGVCILMAAPLGLPLAMAGGSIAWLIQSRATSHRPTTATSLIVFLFVPMLMGAEQATHLVPPVYSVTSSIEIDAPSEAVWKHVIAVVQMPEPHELLFRAGIAYPIRAEIFGHGVGAERRCIFSTGTFIEPIKVWDEPRELRFSVTANPAPMQEWTLYSKLETPHLHGFLVSNGGQFLLTALPGGRTRLQGTTWYRHTMWPAAYWRLWSNEIIHEIHMRVFRHIKENTEQEFLHAQLN